ncbi:hypothetical protein Tco_1021398 [Tanacetum coccineum]
MKSIKSGYDTDVMYDIAKVAGKIQIYVSHHPVDLSTELIPDDGSLEEAYAAQGKLEIYIDHVGVNLVIAKYICPNATLAEMMNHVITDYTSDNEDEKMRLRREQEAEATLADKLLCELTRVVEQMQTREIHITMLHAMPITSLNSYGLHTLLMTQEADIRTTYNLRTTRDELLRSIVEKQKFIDNYMAI